jgi:hypothetical protein
MAAMFREGIDANTVLAALIDERVNLALERLEDLHWPKWMDEKTAAKYLGLKSPKSLGNARRDGKIVGHCHGHKEGYRYAKAELDHYAESLPTCPPRQSRR